MNLLQENQQTLEKMEKESREVIAARRAKINDIDKNILMLQDSHTSRQDSLSYYKNMLDSNNQRHGGAAAAKGDAVAGGGRASGFSQANKPKSTGVAQRAGAGLANHESGSGPLSVTTSGFGRGGKAIPQSALNIYLSGLGATREETKSIDAAIN